MVYGYLKHKDEIFEQILVDPDNPDENLVLEDETHELYVTGKLKSFLQNQDHRDFVGIVDLLLLTNKGFVVIDYKTSTYEPDWDGYLDQIYRYIFMLQSEFPDVPVVKVGIINIKKNGDTSKENGERVRVLQSNEVRVRNQYGELRELSRVSEERH